jgi:hypothetical protein
MSSWFRVQTGCFFFYYYSTEARILVLALMFLLPYSLAMALVSPITPALAAQ